MEAIDFDLLLAQYKTAVDAWIDAIRHEESLATSDHSMKEMEKWDSTGLAVRDAEDKAKKARDAYQNALREKNYGF